MKTICITGGNGLLGSKLLQALLKDTRVVSLDIQDAPLFQHENLIYQPCDITRRKETYDAITKYRPEVILHPAAMTNVDGCEKEQQKAWDINAAGSEHVAQAAAALDAGLVHLSTDYVFDGENGPYTEEDVPHPISVYGESKLEGERLVQEIYPPAAIARTMVLYGYQPGVRPNFATWLVEALKTGQSVNIVTDQYGNATLADDLARAVLLLAREKASGIYHTAGSEWNHRYDFALKLASVFHFDATLIQPTTSDQFKQVAPRPLRSGLDCSKIKHDFGFEFSDVVTGLKQLRNQMQEDE